MAKLGLVIAIVIALLAFSNISCGTPAGEKPTFTDCRPHIDATIRNLAAKAVNAGEKPTEPQSADYATEETEEPLSKQPEKVKVQEKLEASKGSSEQNAQVKRQLFVSVKEALELKRQQELKNKRDASSPKSYNGKTASTKHQKPKTNYQSIEKNKKPGHSTDKSKKPSHSVEKENKPSHQVEKPKTSYTKVNKNEKSEDKITKFDKTEKKYEFKKNSHYNSYEENHKSDERKKEYKKDEDHPKYDNHKTEDESRGSKISKSKGKESPSKTKPGIFNQFIGAIFGTSEIARDEKFASPWTTHKEFAKKPSKDVKKKPVNQGPGKISQVINKCVGILFGLPETKRSAKWAEPWQTHPEFAKNAKVLNKGKAQVKEKPWEKGGFFSFSFLNSFIELLFPKPTNKRDEKFSKPWQTHKEFQRMKETKPVKQTESKDKSNHSKPSKGGIINGIVSMFFELPSGSRDPKWAEPWQSHDGFRKLDKKEISEKKKKSIEAGLIGGLMNKAVFLIFKKPTEPRDSKWSEPWQTHKEHAKDTLRKGKKVVAVDTRAGFIGSAFNSFVEIVFGKSVDHRDSKFAKPWQSHQEFANKVIAQPSHEPERRKDSKPSSKPVPEQKPIETSKYVKHEEAPVSKKREERVTEKKEHAYVEREDKKPKVDTPSIKQAEKPVFHSSPKEVNQPSSVKPSPTLVVDTHKKPDRPVLEKVVEQKKERREKIIEYDEQIVVVPSHVRSRDHIDSILGVDEISIQSASKTEHVSQTILKELKDIYETSISPLEKTYKYHDISNRHISDAELHGPPVVLLLGPYSTGKSSFINYLLGVEFTKRAMKTGTPPSHGAFRIIQYGNHDRDLDGTEVCGQWLFSSLQKFGQNFVDQIKGKTLNAPLLKAATFVEAPGVLEMRRPNERLYPLNDVLQWFIDRADLILVMFDYTKLDAGYEMEAILDQLKGREAQTRILLNKADQVPPEELIKVQGSLFWNLSPLLGVNAPPIVYAGSYASYQYRPASPIKLFEAQEEALLYDIANALKSRVNNRIAIVRRHAVRVRNHAQMVDTYLNTFYKNKGFLTSKHKLADDIIDSPHDYNIYEGLTLQSNVSRYDLPDAEVYRDFFRIHNLYDFKTLHQTCTYIGGCPLEKIDAAVNKQLPQLMKKYRKLLEAGGSKTHEPPTFGEEKPSHAGAHARAGKL